MKTYYISFICTNQEMIQGDFTGANLEDAVFKAYDKAWDKEWIPEDDTLHCEAR